MNVLFLSLLDFDTFDERNIYSDLLREFIKNGHRVCCISPVEKRKNQETKLLRFGENGILKLKIGNITKCNIIEKGISTIAIESQFIAGIKKYFSAVKFDLVLYSTPPITFCNAISYVKKREGAKSYLMLKDIFPQNSLDIGLLSASGIKGLIYRFFRNKEQKLYRLSDKIGCMSRANVKYVVDNNPEVPSDKVELCPNSIEPLDLRLDGKGKTAVREAYGLPQDKTIFVYGGNLGRPQDVPFIVKTLKACADMENVFFVIAGSGTDRHFLEEYVREEHPRHVKLLGAMPKDEYDKMIAACDVGLIFLDHRFTIPNFPSRLLAYMQAGLPVLACTDIHTDVGQVIVEGDFGFWCESTDADKVADRIQAVCRADLREMGENSYRCLIEQYDAKDTYKTIQLFVHNEELI